MKKIFLSLIAVAIACGMSAQTVKIMNGETVVATYTSSQFSKVVFEEEAQTPQYTYVDLGLSVKWATMNVGATNGTTAESWYGDYFAWGETTGYTTNTSDGRSFNWASYKWMADGQSSWTQVNKYTYPDGQTSASWYDGSGNFIGDNKTTLEPADDAATANWGGSWRMPTHAEQEELRNNCTWNWTTDYQGISGLNGYVVSATNGNSIFLPAAGSRRNSSLDGAGSSGLYWSSSLDEGYSRYAWRLYFSSSLVSTSSHHRYYGRSVRPVCQ